MIVEQIKEDSLWDAIGKIPNPKTDKWYLSVGQGMGGALNIAVNKNAYIISDRILGLVLIIKRA